MKAAFHFLQREMFFVTFSVSLEKFTIADFRIITPVEVRPKPNSVFKVDDQDIPDPMEIAN